MMTEIGRKTTRNAIYYSFALFYILAFGYFYLFGRHILFFQENQHLFIFSTDYIREFLAKPGGPLVLAGNFLTQFYFHPLAGSLILAAVLVLPAILIYRISILLYGGRPVPVVIPLLPSSLLLLLQTDFNHQMYVNLGFLLVPALFLLSVPPADKIRKYLPLFAFPLLYYVAGAFAWIFSGMYILFTLLHGKGKSRILIPVSLLFIATGTFIISRDELFLRTAGQLLVYPIPLLYNFGYMTFFLLVAIYISLFPLLLRPVPAYGVIKKIKTPAPLYQALLLFALMILSLSALYNPQDVRACRMKKMIFEGNWMAVIEMHEKKPSRYLAGQYFYNIALSETHQLGHRVFTGAQDFKRNSLILPFDQHEHLNRGVYFYYSIGLINEAHRWAYESMVAQGFRPQNIIMLIKCNLINENFRIAEIYTSMLKQTLFYRSIAREYEELLNDPGLIRSHPELGEKMKLLPEKDFFIDLGIPQNNLLMLLEGNPYNSRAFEYKLVWMLFAKGVEEVAQEIGMMKNMGYSMIPRHIEEAAMIYYGMTGNLPELGGLSISPETRRNYENYLSAYHNFMQNPSPMNEKIIEKYSNTYWYYFHFK